MTKQVQIPWEEFPELSPTLEQMIPRILLLRKSHKKLVEGLEEVLERVRNFSRKKIWSRALEIEEKVFQDPSYFDWEIVREGAKEGWLSFAVPKEVGGQGYLGFRKMIKGLEYFLSTGIPGNKKGEMLLEGERFKQNPKIAKEFYESIPFQKHEDDFAVFMPLENVDLNKYKPDLVIFLVNMDQLGGFIQLFNYDTNNGIKLGLTSACGSIITEPMAEIGRKPVARATIGLLSDMLARRLVPRDLASFTVPFDRLLQVYSIMDESFLPLNAWQRILKRI